MKGSLFAGDVELGLVELTDLDSPMGVAMGRFHPGEAYKRKDHANVVDGEFLGERGSNFEIRRDDGVVVEDVGIALSDYAELGLIEIEVFWRNTSKPSFEEAFLTHPQYRAYWDLDLPPEKREANQAEAREALAKYSRGESAPVGSSPFIVLIAFLILTACGAAILLG